MTQVEDPNLIESCRYFYRKIEKCDWKGIYIAECPHKDDLSKCKKFSLVYIKKVS